MHTPPAARTAPEAIGFRRSGRELPRESACSFPVAVRYVLFPLARFGQCSVGFDEQLASAALALVRGHLSDVSTQPANKALQRTAATFCAQSFRFIHRFLSAQRPRSAAVSELHVKSLAVSPTCHAPPQTAFATGCARLCDSLRLLAGVPQQRDDAGFVANQPGHGQDVFAHNGVLVDRLVPELE